MRIAIFATRALCILCVLPGCSTDQLYRIGQAWQRDQCQRIQDRLIDILLTKGGLDSAAFLSVER